MPKFTCDVFEKVTARIELVVEADTKEDAAQIARDLWVNNAEGECYEGVDERWVEIDGEIIITVGDD